MTIMDETTDRSESRHILLNERPVVGETDRVWGGEEWSASWVEPDDPAVAARPNEVWYRLRFELDEPAAVRVHVSGDGRYLLELDGEAVGRGPQRGDLRHWSYESYDLRLGAGEHVLMAVVSSPGVPGEGGHLAPAAQVSLRPGFLLAAEGGAEGGLAGVLDTGHGDWEWFEATGLGYEPPTIGGSRFAGGTERIDGRAYAWEQRRGGGEGWRPVRVQGPAVTHPGRWGELDSGRTLTPARLPAMLDRPFPPGRVRYVGPSADPADPATHDAAAAAAWQAVLRGGGDHGEAAEPVAVRAPCVVLIDLEEYACAYPELTLEGGGGGEVRLDWAEALFVERRSDRFIKGHRDRVDGLHFVGRGDTFIADDRRRTYRPGWWRAGRYLLLTLTPSESVPLHIAALRLRETRYPLDTLPPVEVDDPPLARALPILERGLLMSMHETYVDCPYYEQLQYVGDTRLEALCTYVRSRDDRLPRRAIRLFGWSRLGEGLTQARYPSTSPQVIPPFCLYWVLMLHDHALWRGGRELVQQMMPAARSILEAYAARVDDAGLPHALPGWNFVDWVPHYPQGVAPGAGDAVNATVGWHLVMTLHAMAELEVWLGEPGLADRWRDLAGRVAQGLERACFDEAAGLYAEEPGGSAFSEHAQCMAVLSGALPAERCERLMRAMLGAQGLAEATIYFSFYVFEALGRVGLVDPLHARFDLWRGLPELGFCTPPEKPEPSRSDCHGWGSHPLFHLPATVLGIRPASFGFDRVEVRPLLGPMRHAAATLPHPRGTITARVDRRDSALHAEVTLPEGVEGELVWNGETRPLTAGVNRVEL